MSDAAVVRARATVAGRVDVVAIVGTTGGAARDDHGDLNPLSFGSPLSHSSGKGF